MVKSRSVAMLKGEEIGREHNLLQLPVDPLQVAGATNIEVCEKDCPGGASGMLVRVGDAFTICYATHLANRGYERFSIAHELGHYFLPGHPEQVFDAHGVHTSRAGGFGDNKYERQADEFAVGLLLPKGPFGQAMKRAGEGLSAIEQLAETCLTSLTATAIRFVECSREPLAVIVSNEKGVQFSALSASFADLQGVHLLRRETHVPIGGPTSRLLENRDRVRQGERLDDTVNLQDWFANGPDQEVVEEACGLGGYGRVLTILTGAVAPDEEDDDNERAEWNPRFR